MNNTIFIFGMTKRVGTNYLMRMFKKHAGCVNCPPIWESYLLSPSEHLVNYVREVEKCWGSWKDKGPFKEELLESIGEGLNLFLRRRAGNKTSRLLTKTPSVAGLRYFPYVFPNAKCVILIRDGRDVTASMMKGFGLSFEEAMQRWVNAGIYLIDSINFNPNFSKNHLIICYEELVENTVEILKKIFDHFSLDHSIYNFKKLEAMPIYGSSFIRDGKDKLHWNPVPVTKEFKKLCRWANWDKKQRRQFKDIAGETMNQLGYSCEY